MLGIKFENPFQDFKLSDMEFAIFLAPHNFDVDKASEDIQMELPVVQYYCSPRKIE
jgi:hypothetical protein